MDSMQWLHIFAYKYIVYLIRASANGNCGNIVLVIFACTRCGLASCMTNVEFHPYWFFLVYSILYFVKFFVLILSKTLPISTFSFEINKESALSFVWMFSFPFFELFHIVLELSQWNSQSKFSRCYTCIFPYSLN